MMFLIHGGCLSIRFVLVILFVGEMKIFRREEMNQRMGAWAPNGLRGAAISLFFSENAEGVELCLFEAMNTAGRRRGSSRKA